MRLALRTPAVLLGVPIPESENPYLAAPVGRARYLVEVEDCGRPGITIEGLDELRDGIGEFWRSTVSGMELKACARLALESVEGSPTRAGLYASSTIALVHALSKYYGETLSSMELVELSRYGDPYYSGVWGFVLDALRYSVVEGACVVYRNDEEHYPLGPHEARVTVHGMIGLGEPLVSKDSVGPDVYSALIHAMGVTVLEASLRMNEGASLADVVKSLGPVHEGLMTAIWGAGRSDGCITSPGLPREAEILCPEYAGARL